jgi:hypothetical protein
MSIKVGLCGREKSAGGWTGKGEGAGSECDWSAFICACVRACMREESIKKQYCLPKWEEG